MEEPVEALLVIDPQVGHPRVPYEAGDLVVDKHTDDGFDGTPLAEILDQHAFQHLAVSGLLSEMCVAATARSALARNFQLTLVTHAHATYDLDDIPASSVARVAEHSLGDRVRLRRAHELTFRRTLTEQR